MIRLLYLLQESRIRNGFKLYGDCMNPDSYSGIPLAAIPLKRFSCDKPEFADDEEEVVAKLNQQVFLECKPKMGNPQPEINWKIDFELEENQVN